ncbi:glycosyltransferase involved in cell wall biosynthesis [Nakamurella sp. UYEF19]|uniref:glycosyltransferase family 4 protein n=1 Tax=Nakamurella sp. UYEF19 TaxID=1756392 RepID=UPI0033926572
MSYSSRAPSSTARSSTAPSSRAARGVVLVTPGFPPSRGGVEEHTGRLAAEFVAAGLPVQVLTSRRSTAKAAAEAAIERRDGMVVNTFPAWRTSIMSVSPRLLLAAVKSARTAGVLHVHSYHAMNAAALLGRGRNAHVVFTPHYHGAGHTTAARALHVFYRYLGRSMFRAADIVICVSEAERDAVVADFPFVASRIQVIPNGIDTRALSTAAPFDGEPPTVLSIGRLEEYKGVAGLLRAFGSVPHPAQLVIVGEGSQRESLEKLCSEIGLADRVRFLGFIDTPEMHRWLSTAGVLVSLSEHEAFGMVPLEAAGAGARVVLSDIPAHREIARLFLGAAAVLVPGRDEAAVSDAIRAQLRPGPRVDLELPDWVDVARRTIEIYDREPSLPRTTGQMKMKSSRRRSPQITPPMPHSRRIGLLDSAWQGHWTAIAMAPVEVPSADELRERMLRYIQENPSAQFAGVISADNRRWVPVPADEREQYVRRIIVQGDDPDLACMTDHIDRHRPALDSRLPLVVLGKASIVLFHSHMFGDASSFSQLVLNLAIGDLDSVVTMEPRADMALAVKALLGQPRSSYRAWADIALRPFRGQAAETGPPAPVAHVPSTPPSVAFAESVLSNGTLRELTRWRNTHFRGVSLTSILTASTYCALAREGIPMSGTGYYSLFDLRRYLPSGAARFGNLAKSVHLEADMTDPRSIGDAMDAVIASARVIPATMIGALATALRRGSHRDATDSAGPVTLSFVSMPTLPGLAEVPWTGAGPKRYCGVGFPVGRLGMSVFAIRLRDHMEISATFDGSVVDPTAVRRAMNSLCDPEVLVQLSGPLPAAATRLAATRLAATRLAATRLAATRGLAPVTTPEVVAQQ